MRDEATAFHESGHGVIGRVLGLPVGVVTIEPTEEFSGWCQVDGFVNPTAENMRADLLATLAASYAMARYQGVRWIDGTYPGGAGDMEQFEQRLCMYANRTGRDASKAEPMLFQEAEQLVAEHWPEIQRLARYLMWLGTLSYPAYGANPRAVTQG